jgi:hypothetical protein
MRSLRRIFVFGSGKVDVCNGKQVVILIIVMDIKFGKTD